jgi:D-glycero-D-manno-heptose 1,7-bisphosphate phosphatase
MFEIFGNAGIYSVDGLFYSESSLKTDYYAKPNIGMFHRTEKEIFNGKIRFKDKGFYVGDKMSDLKAAERIGATPILVRTGYGLKTEEDLNKFSKEKLRKKTKVFDSLLQFAERLP